MADADFIHGIYLTDKLKCSNIRATGTLCSLMYASIYFQNVRSDYYTLPLDELREKAHELFTGMINPRCGLLVQASLLDQVDQVAKISPEEAVRVRAARDRELEFERVRRIFEKVLPSRLTCLYLAENDPECNGRISIGHMLTKPERQPYVFEVRVSYQLDDMHRVDSRWYDIYADDPQEQHIINYWQGDPVDENPHWEYLLEGEITLTNDDERKYVSAFGS